MSTTYPLPREWQGVTSQTNMVTPTHMDVDGKVMDGGHANGRVFRRFATGKWEDAARPPGERRDHPLATGCVRQGHISI